MATAEPSSESRVVVIGASAGGVETLQRVVAELPADLDACVLVVLHLAPSSPSLLSAILGRAGPLPCHTAADGEQLVPAQILVAPPDHHLAISDGHVALTVGPRENGHRPSVDVLFRTAAEARDRRVVGVVLSGTRDDGAAGLAVIKAHGGSAIVQDPAEALYSGMPASAIAQVQVDAVVPSAEIAKTIVKMVENDPHPGGSSPPEEDAEQPGSVAVATCPECGGILSEHRDAGVTQWRCRVGHRYSAGSLADAQADDVEAAVWAAVRALNDRRVLLERLANQFELNGQVRSAKSFRRRAQEAEQQADIVRQALGQAAVTSLRKLTEDEESVVEEAAGGAG